MRHLRLLPLSEETTMMSVAPPDVLPELAERMGEARRGGSIEAALATWGLKVRSSQGRDVAWCTTRPPWRCPARIDSWWSPVWLPTAEHERQEQAAPFRLASLFENAA